MRRGALTVVFIVCLASGVSAQQTLTIHHLDVGTGDTTLLVMGNGRTLLVRKGVLANEEVLEEVKAVRREMEGKDSR